MMSPRANEIPVFFPGQTALITVLCHPNVGQRFPESSIQGRVVVDYEDCLAGGMILSPNGLDGGLRVVPAILGVCTDYY